MLAVNALSAADGVIIPLQAERPALDGVQDLMSFIHGVVWEQHNPDLRIDGILPTMFKRTTTHSMGVIHKARETWGDKVFPIEIPDTIAFPRAFSKGQPLLTADPENEAAKAYLQVAAIINQASAYEKTRPEQVSVEAEDTGGD